MGHHPPASRADHVGLALSVLARPKLENQESQDSLRSFLSSIKGLDACKRSSQFDVLKLDASVHEIYPENKQTRKSNRIYSRILRTRQISLE